MSAPKPFVGYLIEHADFTPPPRMKTSLVWRTSPLHYALNDALAAWGALHSVEALESGRFVPYKVTVTFEAVEP